MDWSLDAERPSASPEASDSGRAVVGWPLLAGRRRVAIPV